MKRIFAQAQKELTQMRRDWLTVALALILPLILLVLYGKAIAFSVTGVDVIVRDFDQTPASRNYVEGMAGSLTFEIVPLAGGMTPEEALESETARAIVIIPVGFERELSRGGAAEVQWLFDATDTNTANILRGNAKALTQAFARQYAHGNQTVEPVNVEMRLWFNPGRENDKYIGPGVIAVVLALFPPLLASLAMS